MMRIAILISFQLFIASVPLLGQELQGGKTRPNGNLAFQLGDDGPWNHRVLLAFSKDGFDWKIDERVLVERGSVPELFLGPSKLPTADPGAARTNDGGWLVVGTGPSVRGPASFTQPGPNQNRR